MKPIEKGDTFEIVDAQHLAIAGQSIHARKIGAHPLPEMNTTTFYLRLDVAGSEIIEALAADGIMRVMAVFRSADHFKRLPEFA